MRAAILALCMAFAPISQAHAQAQTSAQLIEPRILQMPDADLLYRHYPPSAWAQGVVGRVLLDCRVGVDGNAECEPVAETPPGWGFGDGAIDVARAIRFAPATSGGTPIVRRIRLPVTFRFPDEEVSPYNSPAWAEWIPESFPNLPDWEEAPNYFAVMRAYPLEAARAETRGRGVLSCRVKSDRGLACTPFAETPAGMGFGAAALELSTQFRVSAFDEDFIARHRDEPFWLPVNFGASADQEPLSTAYVGPQPFGLRVASEIVQSIYPEAARAAGITGEVLLLCTLQANAPLDCAIESETPPQWGFGDAVINMHRSRARPVRAEDFGMMAGDLLRVRFSFVPPT